MRGESMNNDPDVQPDKNVSPELDSQSQPAEVTPPAEQVESLEENAAPVETAFATPARARSPKMMIGIVLAALIVLLGGGSVFAYTFWYQNPDKVVHDAVMNAVQAKSLTATGKISYKTNGATVDIALNTHSKDGNGEVSADAKIIIDNDTMKHDFTANGTVRVVNDTVYVKLKGIKTIVEDMTGESGGQIPSYATSIFNKIEDKWISIKPSDYQEMDESIAKQQTCVTDLMKKLQSDKKMTNELTQLYKNNQILVIQDKLGSRKVNNIDSLGYKVTANKDAAAGFARGLEDTAFGKELKNCNGDIDFKEIANNIAKDSSSDKNTPAIELWVSSFGHTITEVNVNGKEDNGNDSLSLMMQPTFNKAEAVEAPTDATPLKTILEDIQSLLKAQYGSSGVTESMLPMSSFEDELDAEFQSAI